MTHLNKIKEYLKKMGSASQKELSEVLKTDVSRVSKLMRFLVENGTVTVTHRAGFSMRYSLRKDFEVIRTVSGNPLYTLYREEYKDREIGPVLDDLILTLVSSFLNGSLSKQNIQEGTTPSLKGILLLSEILIAASPGQIKATKQALIEYQGSDSNDDTH